METLKYGKVKARKAHVCSFFGSTIPVGAMYWRSTHIANGDLYDWKSHEKCAELVNMLDMEGDEGVTMEDFFEYVREAYDEIQPDTEANNFNEQVDFVYNHLKHREGEK